MDSYHKNRKQQRKQIDKLASQAGLPDDPGLTGRFMKDGTFIGLEPAQEGDGYVRIANLRTRVDQRGQGRAGRLLDALCWAADLLGIHLTLEADALGKDGLSQRELIRFYKRRGFRPKRPGFRRNMIRRSGGS